MFSEIDIIKILYVCQRQSSFLWVLTLLLFSPIGFFIRMRQI